MSNVVNFAFYMLKNKGGMYYCIKIYCFIEIFYHTYYINFKLFYTLLVEYNYYTI